MRVGAALSGSDGCDVTVNVDCMTIWGIHSNQPTLDLLGNGFVAVGWSEVGDLLQYEHSPGTLKEVLLQRYPDAKPGAIPVWAGICARVSPSESL